MRRPIYLILCLLAASPAAAAAVQSLAQIRSTVAAFLEQRVASRPGRSRIEVGAVDRRLRLPACAERLQPFLPRAGRLVGRVTVGIRCRGARPWKLFVGATVDQFRPVVVLTRPVDRGEILSADRLRLEERNTSTLRGRYFLAPAPLVGNQLTRSLPAGAVLSPRVITAPKVVRRGQLVTLLARTGRLEVRMEGKALAGGTTGDRIRVRNARSKRVVEGVITRPGVVRIPM